jgi:hypothetical protein
MSYPTDYAAEARDLFAIDAEADDRAAFISRTYLHLCGAVLAFIAKGIMQMSNAAQ